MTYRAFTQHDKAGYSLKRRARTMLRRLFGSRAQKSQDLRFVTINGKRFKRLVLSDSYLAAEIERNLMAFGPCHCLPRLIGRHENEIWLEFVDGPVLRQVDEASVPLLVDFYATVYARQPRQVAAAELSIQRQSHQNLRFLNQVGVLTDDTYRQLDAIAERLAPETVWIGFDYVDPVLKNFVIAEEDARLCAVDVESLSRDQLIGWGVAKAHLHWLDTCRDVFLESLVRDGVPDFRPYFPFLELYFLAGWTRTKVLTGKWKAIDPARFERFRDF